MSEHGQTSSSGAPEDPILLEAASVNAYDDQQHTFTEQELGEYREQDRFLPVIEIRFSWISCGLKIFLFLCRSRMFLVL
jgi:hypothetical protein